MFGGKEEPQLEITDIILSYAIVHWQGIICFVTPIIFIGVLTPFPPQQWQWTAYCLLVVAIYWVSECIPLAVTSFIPLIVFPMAGVMSATEVCRCYINDSVFMFLGTLMLAASVEQSGLHKRMAFLAIRILGYSHAKLLLAIVVVTSFVSLWITNTAAASMMVPIIFALLKVFEEQKLLSIYETNADGEKFASDITTCYFCTATYAATFGGVGTLIGTGTNLVFKSFFMQEYPAAPEYLSFPMFSAFGIPYMIICDTFMLLYMLIKYVGLFRPKSDAALRATVPLHVRKIAREKVDRDYAALGKLTYWEIMVIVLFGGAIISFFTRSPQLFKGWADVIKDYFSLKDEKFVRDSAVVGFFIILMILLPSNLSFFSNFKAKFHEDLPKSRIPSVLGWKALMAELPFSFIFLLGGGIALSTAAKKSGLNDKIGEFLKGLQVLPDALVLLLVIISVVLITNLAANVAVCNVFAPIAMELAKQIKRNPLQYCIAAGLSASHALLLPVGTPGNLVVKSAASIPTIKMVIAGTGPTISTILITWGLLYTYAPILWPILNTASPDWAVPQ